MLAGYIVTEEAPLGFVVRVSRGARPTYVLTDRCGFVLGTDKRPSHIVTMLHGHLSALLPVEANVVRIRARSFQQRQGITLCTWPLLFVPSLEENRLAAAGVRIVDRLAVDVDLDGRIKSPSLPGAVTEAPSHLHPSSLPSGTPLARIALPLATEHLDAAGVVALLASECMAGSRKDRLRVAVALARHAATDQLQAFDQASLFGRPD